MAKVRRPFDVSTTAQVAALASLSDGVEVTSRRVANRRGLEELTRILVKHGLEPAPGAVANFVYVEIGEDTPQFFERLLEEGVIVRPLGGFGASTAIRISVGTPDELEFLDAALGRIRP
jgi:histidinol-phosphate aminotransferase